MTAPPTSPVRPASMKGARRSFRRRWYFGCALLLSMPAAGLYLLWLEHDLRFAKAHASSHGWGVNYYSPYDRIRENWRAIFDPGIWRNEHRDISINKWGGRDMEPYLLRRLAPWGVVVHDGSKLQDLSPFAGNSRMGYLRVENALNLTSIDAVRTLPNLNHLSLGRCSELSSVEAVGVLSKLEKLSISSCASITNLDTFGRLNRLRKLSLNGATNLANVEGLRSLTSLEELQFKDCTALMNIDVIKSLKNLRQLTLSHSTGLSKEYVGSLRAAMPATTIYGP